MNKNNNQRENLIVQNQRYLQIYIVMQIISMGYAYPMPGDAFVLEHF